MTLAFPSRDFDEAVAAVCHGVASDGQMQALNRLLRQDPAARDEYILRLELHARLASERELFAGVDGAGAGAMPDRDVPNLVSLPGSGSRRGGWTWVRALAACAALLAAGWWGARLVRPGEPRGTTSRAVAMLGQVVDARWAAGDEAPRLGAPLEPGRLRLRSGLAQIVFYSGARVVIEGPAELQLVSPGEAVCDGGRLTAEVPPQARGFRVRTPRMEITDLGTSFGLAIAAGRTELHVFKGSVEFRGAADGTGGTVREGGGAVIEGSGPARTTAANPTAFASLFDLHRRSSAADVRRHQEWREAGRRLDNDPSLLVRFDFETANPPDWRLPNTGGRGNTALDGTIIGCQWVEGRWPDKPALEFRGVSDRVRLNVPGDFEALTLAAWVRVQGLAREFNSLFMCDGFGPGTAHWLIRKDGVLGLTAIGSVGGEHQICASPPVLGLDQFGIWLHLAVVLDGRARRVVQYVNGLPVGEKPLRVRPPFRVGAAELGNWNADGFPGNDPSLIRNFSGAMDEFCLFSRALGDGEIQALHAAGRPEPDSTMPPAATPATRNPLRNPQSQ